MTRLYHFHRSTHAEYMAESEGDARRMLDEEYPLATMDFELTDVQDIPTPRELPGA